MDQAELKDAITCYLEKQGFKTSQYEVSVNIKVSRSSEDNKIEVDLVKKAVPEIPLEPQVKEAISPATAPFGD